MSYDSYSIVYHLTSDGWEAARGGCIVPNDRLLTAELEVTQSSGFGPEDRVSKTLWASPGLSEAETATLEQTFPKQNRHLEKSRFIEWLHRMARDGSEPLPALPRTGLALREQHGLPRAAGVVCANYELHGAQAVGTGAQRRAILFTRLGKIEELTLKGSG
jgi:hypothetical protein